MKFLPRRDIYDIGFAGLKAIVLALSILMIVVPLFYVVSVSFRPTTEVFLPTFHWLPQEPTTSGWESAFSELSDELLNSLIIGTGTAILSLLITIPGAYAFARKEFPGRRAIFYSIVIALLFPYILLIIPITDTWVTIGLYDSYVGLWVAYQVFVTPFAIWILRDFFERLPANLEESARVYGCTQFGAFVRVVLPLSLPAIAAVGFLAFLTGWNDFLFSNMLTRGSEFRPAVVQLFLNVSGGGTRQWPALMAQTLIIGIPPTILYLVARRQLTQAFEV